MQENHPIETDTITNEQVCDFLRKHPHFFEHHAHLLTEIHLPSPHGNGVISLAERQQLAQRDKIRLLEIKLADLLDFADENDATSAKLHDFCIKLILEQNENSGFATLQQQINASMQQDFSVTQSLICIWAQPTDESLEQEPSFASVATEFKEWVTALEKPFCGEKPATISQLPNDLSGDHLQSFVFIPLQQKIADTKAFGVLILGADNPQRFKADMGTMYLERIGDLVSAVLVGYLKNESLNEPS